MAANATDGITWLLAVQRGHKDWLAPIRHWQHLTMATDEDKIWVTGFSQQEITGVIVKSIPVKTIWYQQGPYLFPEGSILPARKAPSLLWSPIERGLPLELPPENHNYFGVSDKVVIRLVETQQEHAAAALIVAIDDLKLLMETAPAIRLKPLKWSIINNQDALIVGVPLLPVPGNTFWQEGNFLIPAGYDFEWPSLRKTVGKMTNNSEPSLLIWLPAGGFIRLPQTSLKPLTIGSFRQSEILWKSKTNTV
jgi:hypothetical protein